MPELQQLLAVNHSAISTSSDKTIELQTFELPENYSILINKLERLALGLDSAFSNFSLDRKEVDIALSGTSEFPDIAQQQFGSKPFAAGRAPPPRASHHIDDVEYTRVVSDIWIGVILTLLIVSVIFFICSCFLYHKFQQWKNSYRANPNDPVEICRHYGADFEAESLPSYTIVSGLPTYDDALDEFRKAGIILSPSMPVVKLFERDSKENQFHNLENGGSVNGGLTSDNSDDNISLSSTCTCGAGNSNTITQNNNTTNTGNFNLPNMTQPPQIIELSPEQLASLSEKRLSLQISFNNSVRRNSRPRIDLYRQANRNNLLRSQRTGFGGAAAMSVNGGGGGPFDGFPQIHRSASTLSLEPNRHRLQHLQHRGSLC